MSDDQWDIADATNEVVYEVLSELADDEGFFDRVLYFADKEYSGDSVKQIKMSLARILSDVKDNY